MQDLIKLRRELNQLIIDAFANFMIAGLNRNSTVCARLHAHPEIHDVYYHYNDNWADGTLPCNRCKYFNDFTIDRAAFIID